MRRRARYVRDALREGGKFLHAVLSLASLVTGVALLAVLDLPSWAIAVIVPIALLAAVAEGGYRLQSKQREQIARLDAALQAAELQVDDSNKRRALKDLLGRLSVDGSVLLTLGEHLQASALNAWDAQICDLVRQALGDGERSRLDWGVAPFTYKPVAGLKSDDAGLIIARLRYINCDLIPRVDSMLIESDFDPQQARSDIGERKGLSGP